MFRLYQVYSGKVQAVFDGSKPVASLPAYDLYIAEVRSLCWRRCRLAFPLLRAHALRVRVVECWPRPGFRKSPRTSSTSTPRTGSCSSSTSTATCTRSTRGRSISASNTCVSGGRRTSTIFGSAGRVGREH